MSEKPTGYGTMVLGSQDRPFQVGTNQGDIFCRLHHRKGEDGKPMTLAAYGQMFAPETLRKMELTGGDLRDFVYSALVAGYENDGLRVDFNHIMVGNWIDASDDPAEAIKPIHEMLNQVLRRVELAAERAEKKTVAPKAKTKTRPKKAS